MVDDGWPAGCARARDSSACVFVCVLLVMVGVMSGTGSAVLGVPGDYRAAEGSLREKSFPLVSTC